MSIWKRAAACAALALAAGAAFAQGAQTYPTKPIRMVAPFPAGGGYDFMARNIGQRLHDSWGQAVVVENRAGADGNIGAEAIARAAPDGYNLLLGGIGPFEFAALTSFCRETRKVADPAGFFALSS